MSVAEPENTAGWLEHPKKGKNFSANNVTGKRKKGDFYETPYHVTRMLLDFEKFEGDILEPACGNYAMSGVIENYYDDVTARDIMHGDDFLLSSETFDNVITNPPFSKALEFILHAKKIANKKIALLLPLSYLHGKTRYNQIYQDTEFRLEKVCVFTRFLNLDCPILENGNCETGMIVYAWYIWNKDYTGDRPFICHLDNNGYVFSPKKDNRK